MLLGAKNDPGSLHIEVASSSAPYNSNILLKNIRNKKALYLPLPEYFCRHLLQREMALCLAAYFGSTSMCRLLLAAGSDVEESEPKTQLTPLHFAAIRGYELLLSHKADVNSRDRTEFTPLHLASQEGKIFF